MLHICAEAALLAAVGHLQIVLQRQPGRNLRLIVLNQCLELIECLVQLRLRRFSLLHLRKELHQLRMIRLRQRIKQSGNCLFFDLLIRLRLFKCWYVPRHSFPEIMDCTHQHHLCDVGIRELILHQICHQNEPPAVLRHTLMPV